MTKEALNYYHNKLKNLINGTLNNLPIASNQTAGIIKLYNSKGINTDGSITQNSLTKELNGIYFELYSGTEPTTQKNNDYWLEEY